MIACPQCGTENADTLRFCGECGQKLPTTLEDMLDAAETIIGEPPKAVLGGRYVLVEEIGRGGMGIVHRARDRQLDTDIAVKLLPPEPGQSSRAIASLKKEALAAMRRAHPNILRLFNFEETAEARFITMEYIDGPTLLRVLDDAPDGRVDLATVQSYAKGICAAIGYAHSQKVVHQDIKPANIMLTSDGAVKVTDFGIAFIVRDTVSRMTSQQTAGTLLYMAPDLHQGGKGTASSDQYAIGVLVYELLTGEPPFVRGNVTFQHINTLPEPIEGVPDHINHAIQRALAKNPDDRWPSVEEFGEAFAQRIDVSRRDGLLTDARALRAGGNRPEARTAYEAALEVDPESDEAHNAIRDLEAEIAKESADKERRRQEADERAAAARRELEEARATEREKAEEERRQAERQAVRDEEEAEPPPHEPKPRSSRAAILWSVLAVLALGIGGVICNEQVEKAKRQAQTAQRQREQAQQQAEEAQRRGTIADLTRRIEAAIAQQKWSEAERQVRNLRSYDRSAADRYTTQIAQGRQVAQQAADEARRQREQAQRQAQAAQQQREQAQQQAEEAQQQSRIADLKRQIEVAIARKEWSQAERHVTNLRGLDRSAAGRYATQIAEGRVLVRLRTGIDFSSRSDLDLFTTRAGSGRTYAVTGGKLRIANTSEQFNAATLLKNATFTDGTVEVSTRWVSGTDNYAYGLQVRVYLWGVAAYHFGISGNGSFGIWKLLPNSTSAIRTWTSSSAINRRGQNLLRVECQGNTFTFYINGTQVHRATDSSYSSGSVGLYAYPGMTVDFDDLRVVPAE